MLYLLIYFQLISKSANLGEFLTKSGVVSGRYPLAAQPGVSQLVLQGVYQLLPVSFLIKDFLYENIRKLLVETRRVSRARFNIRPCFQNRLILNIDGNRRHFIEQRQQSVGLGLKIIIMVETNFGH